MPESNENEVPTTSQTKKKRNERTEAKFFEDAARIIAEAERLGADFQPPNTIAQVSNLRAKYEAALDALSVNQANTAAEETARNNRENLFKPLSSDVSSLVEYVKSAGQPLNDLNALKSIARVIKGGRAEAIDPNDGRQHISVAHLSYASRTDNYAQFIEQYDSLQIPTHEEIYQAATHRSKLAALRQSTAAVVAAEATSNTSNEQLDRLAYTDKDGFAQK
jgi:hypothetical protein